MHLEQAMRLQEGRLNAVVNLEVLHPAFAQMPELQLSPDHYHHHGGFCRWIKKQPGGAVVCAANKIRSRRIAARGRAFSGCCPRGVWDYAQPVMWQGTLAAIVYVGYFTRPDRPIHPAGHGNTPPEITPEIRRQVARAAEWLAQFIQLLLENWHENGRGGGKKRDDAFYRDQCMHFIGRTYHLNPGLAELADNLRVNVNYLGGVIRRATGRGFRELLTERRLEEAEHLLRHFRHRYSIGEIARRCGFTDSNYFCTVFRRRYGVPPGRYSGEQGFADHGKESQ